MRTPVIALLAVVVVCLAACRSGDRAAPTGPSTATNAALARATSSVPTAKSVPTTSSVPTTTPTPTATRTTPAPTRPAGPRGITPGGMWWGVDSSGPITPAAIQNVSDWYQGARPQFWGRYISGDYTVTAAELAFARQQGIYVYLLVPDRNCSQCSGVDICGNDLTAAQARADALDALAASRAVGVPRGATLFKDIEQVGACRSEPSAAYLTSWYRTLKGTGYRTGFYGNAYQQNYDFPRGYCAAVAADPQFATDVILDMNEDEPLIGAPRGTTGPRNAPRFTPLVPACAPRTATRIWQYGESLDPANYTDIDQAVPGTPGFLSPSGGVT